MKIFGLLLAAVATGIAAGVGSTYATFPNAAGTLNAEHLFGTERERIDARPLPATPGSLPLISVNAEMYDFGVMENGEKGEHKFVVANDGGSPLEIETLEISCSCTSSDLTKGRKVTIAPGETFDVKLSWYANSRTDVFRQAATLGTNDPRRPEVHLIVTGKVVKGVVLEPPAYVISGLSVGQQGERELRILSYRSPDFKILSHEFINGATPEQFDLTFQPLSAEEIDDPAAKAGYKAKLTIKPGLAVGSISHAVLVRTNDPRKPEIKVAIAGSVDGPISVIGPGWISQSNLLRIGAISREEGHKTTLVFKVIGIPAAELKPQVTKVDPAAMQVKLGEAREISSEDRPIVTWPLTIEVPPGGPALNHIGSETGPLGTIEIDTGHPDGGTFRMLVELVTVD